MKNVLLLALFFLFFFEVSIAQVSTRLATITEGSPNNSAGLGVTFTNGLLSDGNLYFRGSSNGLKEAIWKTDGTIAGTQKVIEEGNGFDGNWSNIRFVEDGVLLRGDGGYDFLTAGDNQLVRKFGLPDAFLDNFTKISNGNYVFTTQPDDNLDLFICDSTFEDFTVIQDVHPDGSDLRAYAGNVGVLIYNGNTFQESSPVVYDYASEELIPLEEYVAGFSLSLSALSEGYVYKDFMFLSYQDEDNFFRRHVINMATGQTALFTFLRAPYTIHEWEGKYAILGGGDAVIFDTETLEFQEILFINVFPLGTSRIVGDQLYFIGTNDDQFEQIVAVDLPSGNAVFLPDAITGRSFYNCKMIDYNDEFYYIAEGTHDVLMKYDFSTFTSIPVDTLSVKTGATVVHDLDEVNGKLVFSKRIDFLQHEPYVLGSGGPTSVQRQLVEELMVSPTLALDQITVHSDGHVNLDGKQVQLFDVAGKFQGSYTLDQSQLSVSNLSKGNYYGLVETSNGLFRFSFIKL